MVNLKHYERASGDLQQKVEKFLFTQNSKSYMHQYNEFYNIRLGQLGTRIKNRLAGELGDIFKQLCDIKSDERCVIIGTLFKKMKLQSSILDELSDELNIQPQPILESYTSDDDVLYLEDSSQRIILTGDINIQDFVTGTIVAVVGVEKAEDPGSFVVEKVYTPDMSPAPAIVSGEDRYALLVSGLEFGGAETDNMKYELLLDYIQGHLTSQEEELEKISRIEQIVIAGNSVSPESHDKDIHYKAKYLTKNTVASSVEPVRQLSAYLSQLTAVCPVILLPGDSDPSNKTLPQQPLHPCLFNDESGLLELTSNPTAFELSGVSFLGHSGQPVTNIKLYSQVSSSMEAMERCLRWSHMAPTAPDTLLSYPFTEKDPYIIEQCPHIFFTGNQDEADAKLINIGDSSCLCVSLPRFSKTGQFLLVKLNDLQWEIQSLETGISETN